MHGMTTTMDGHLVHKHTAGGVGVNTAPQHQPMSVTSTGLKYNLSKGKKGMSTSMQRASRSSVALAMRRARKNESIHVEPTNTSMKDDPKSSFTNHTTNNMDAMKIFVLLLHPPTKTFELIQLVYAPETTTVGDLVKEIPTNATEPTLGAQKYTGLVRPNDQMELNNKKLLASKSCHGLDSDTTRTGKHNKNKVQNHNKQTADIQQGEILVAITKGYTAQECTTFAMPILTNRRFTKLLRKSDPLVPKLRRKSDRRHKQHHHNRRSSPERARNVVDIMEPQPEEEDEKTAASSLSSKSRDEVLMQRAMEKALSAAAKANANIPQEEPVTTKNSGEHLDADSCCDGDPLAVSLSSKSTIGSRRSLRSFRGRQHILETPTGKPLTVNDFDTLDGGQSTRSFTTSGSSFQSISWVGGAGGNPYFCQTDDVGRRSPCTRSVVSSGSSVLSVDDSIASWSRGVDASIHPPKRTTTSSACSSVSSSEGRRTLRTKEKHRARSRTMSYLVTALQALPVVAALAGLVAYYCMDAAALTAQKIEERLLVVETPLGWMGFIQCVFVWLCLRKWQFLAIRKKRNNRRGAKNGQFSPPSSGSYHLQTPSQCPYIRVTAALWGRQ